jgi:orotidine-5'-phosphate decarboxylase
MPPENPTGGGAAPATAAALSEGVPEDIRSRLALVIDIDDLVPALRLARELRPWFGVAKVGLELYSAVGPDAIGPLLDLDYEVFLDLKLHDIPTTVGRAARVAGSLGVSYLTLHAQGGMDMLHSGVEGLYEGATRAGLQPPCALAVTVLTSDDSAPPHIMPKRAALAAEAGCGGIVCAAADLAEARQVAPRLRRVVPGIRPAGTSLDDQARPATPREAFEAGADLLVIGRAVTAAEDPEAAADGLVRELRTG